MLEKVKKDNVEFISLQFFDLVGVPKELIIPSEELKDAITDGIWFDGSSIEGFARLHESDLFLKPDISTYSLVPWLKENGKTARVICDIYKSDGKPFEDDPRYILKKIINETNKKGYQFNVGPELEFYLFRQDDTSKTNPIDSGSYFDLTSYGGYKVIKEIITALRSFGINVETSHHEIGKGQYEIDFNYGLALETADKLLTLKYTIRKIAQMYDLRATFMPKPIKGVAGSGMHTHQSLFDIKTGKNLFYDGNNRYRLSKIANNFIAGQLKHIKAMCAILCPTVNSYKRLVTGYEAPVYITWASMNRTTLIRIPNWFKQKTISARIELRCPDPTCNPYLAFAVMLKAGLEGIDKKLQPPEPIEENIFEFDPRSLVKRNIDTLPTSLSDALNELKKDKIVQGTLGKHLYEKYIKIKTQEVNEYKQQVTSWEIDRYLDVF